MESLDILINSQERRIDHLLQLRRQCDEENKGDYPHPDSQHNGNIDYDLEKAYEQLAIYKIRKMMGYWG